MVNLIPLCNASIISHFSLLWLFILPDVKTYQITQISNPLLNVMVMFHCIQIVVFYFFMIIGFFIVIFKSKSKRHEYNCLFMCHILFYPFIVPILSQLFDKGFIDIAYDYIKIISAKFIFAIILSIIFYTQKWIHLIFSKYCYLIVFPEKTTNNLLKIKDIDIILIYLYENLCIFHLKDTNLTTSKSFHCVF